MNDKNDKNDKNDERLPIGLHGRPVTATRSCAAVGGALETGLGHLRLSHLVRGKVSSQTVFDRSGWERDGDGRSERELRGARRRDGTASWTVGVGAAAW